MQTFLPYPSFIDSLQCLDNKRLGKQRVEARQIFNILTGNTNSNAWKNHPAVKMWKGCEIALAIYHDLSIKIWQNRGFRNNMEFLTNVDGNVTRLAHNCLMPFWLGDEDFHASHRSNLLRKYPEWYSQFGWTESNDLPYIWPVS